MVNFPCPDQWRCSNYLFYGHSDVSNADDGIAFQVISIKMYASTLQVSVWQELQAVRTEISTLEEQKNHITHIVKALVVSACSSLI